MNKIKSIQMESIDLRPNTNVALIITIDAFRFVHERYSMFILVEIEDQGSYEWIADIDLHETGYTFTPKSLKVKALNWIFENVKIVKELNY